MFASLLSGDQGNKEPNLRMEHCDTPKRDIKGDLSLHTFVLTQFANTGLPTHFVLHREAICIGDE